MNEQNDDQNQTQTENTEDNNTEQTNANDETNTNDQKNESNNGSDQSNESFMENILKEIEAEDKAKLEKLKKENDEESQKNMKAIAKELIKTRDEFKKYKEDSDSRMEQLISELRGQSSGSKVITPPQDRINNDNNKPDPNSDEAIKSMMAKQFRMEIR